MLEISISDTGIGIEEENLESIFDSFEQGDGQTAREYGGTGLGLSVTKQLVELHGGKIQVQSTANLGSVFSFELEISESQERSTSSERLAKVAITPALEKKDTEKTEENQGTGARSST